MDSLPIPTDAFGRQYRPVETISSTTFQRHRYNDPVICGADLQVTYILTAKCIKHIVYNEFRKCIRTRKRLNEWQSHEYLLLFYILHFNRMTIGKKRILHLGETSTPGGRHLKNAREQRKLQSTVSLDAEFPCSLRGVRSSRPPTSVHKLRPGDIDVIAAMGDSLTAGFGAVSITLPELIFIENRGISWSGGGQSDWKQYLTLPNIIKVQLLLIYYLITNYRPWI